MCFICGKTGWKAADGHGGVDRVVSDMQLKHSIQSGRPVSSPAPPEASHLECTSAHAAGHPTVSVACRFWILGVRRGKSRQRRLKQIRQVFINHGLTDDLGERQRRASRLDLRTSARWSALIKRRQHPDLHLLHKEHLTPAYLTQPPRLQFFFFSPHRAKNQSNIVYAQLLYRVTPKRKERERLPVDFVGITKR